MVSPKRALITGITGQAGSYLAELLLQKGYVVYGLVRRSSTVSFERLQHIQDQLILVPGDLLDQESLKTALQESQPDEIYNLAAQSLTYSSWTNSVLTLDSTALGVARLLEAVRSVTPAARFYQASSSECFGSPALSPQNEETPFRPRSPYGIAKAAAHWTVANYRTQYGLFAVCGIVFNHESPRRGLEFVTRKVTNGAARIKLGLINELELGDLSARRDWGYAPDYVRAMWLMLQAEQPRDYVIGTGVTHSVQDLVEIAFARVGIAWQEVVRVAPELVRPREEHQLVADPSRANEVLGWKPTVSFGEIINRMVDADLDRLSTRDVRSW